MMKQIAFALLMTLAACSHRSPMPAKFVTTQQVTRNATPKVAQQQAPSDTTTPVPLSATPEQNVAAVVTPPPSTVATTQTNVNNPPQATTATNTTAVIVQKPRRAVSPSVIKNSLPPSDKAPHGYHIIIGSYSHAQNTLADRQLRQLIKQGHKAHKIDEKQRIRISVACFNSPEKAASARDTYRQQFKREDLWIYKY